MLIWERPLVINQCGSEALQLLSIPMESISTGLGYFHLLLSTHTNATVR